MTFHIVLNLLVYLVVELMNTHYMISGILLDSISNLYFWLVVICTSGICLAPFYLIRSLHYFFGESVVNNLKYNNYQKDYMKKKYLKMLEELSKCTRSVVKFKKILKQRDFEADNYADKRMKEIVDNYLENKRGSRVNKELFEKNTITNNNNNKERVNFIITKNNNEVTGEKNKLLN
jgi:hypothetical protein